MTVTPSASVYRITDTREHLISVLKNKRWCKGYAEDYGKSLYPIRCMKKTSVTTLYGQMGEKLNNFRRDIDTNSVALFAREQTSRAYDTRSAHKM